MYTQTSNSPRLRCGTRLGTHTQTPAQRIGILGGTFDPPHVGHLALAQAALGQFALDKVIFMVAGRPVFRDPKAVSPAKDRYQMTCLAVQTAKDLPAFEVSRLEIDRQTTTYTIDTLLELQQYYPKDTEFFLIVGTDVCTEFDQWKDAARITELAEFIVADRPGYDLDQTIRTNRKDIPSPTLSFLEIDPISVSSSDLRERISKGLPTHNMLPKEVERYVEEQGLYR